MNHRLGQFQFSLRGLLLLITAAAVLVGLARTFPAILGILAMILLPTLLLYLFAIGVRFVLIEALALAKEHEQFMKHWREAHKQKRR